MSARLVTDLEESVYHSGPELSVSGAKILRKSPALFRYRRENPEHKDVWDEGSVIHGLVLGAGWPVHIIDAPDYRSKPAREARDEARAAGQVPILKPVHERAQRIRDAVHAHPLAGAILGTGEPEQSMYWTDEDTGVACRARTDWVNPAALVDLKSTADASPDAFTKSVTNYGYDMQAHAYSEGYHAATGTWLPFLFVCVEKEPPHQVAVYQLDDAFLERGARHWREALDTYAACTASDTWPGYGTDIQTLSAPRWAQ